MGNIDIGIQLYTLRKYCGTQEGLFDTLKWLSGLQVTSVQLSSVFLPEPQLLRSFCDELGITIACSHSPADRIFGDTDRLAEEHVIYGAKTIGLGSMPGEYRRDGFKEINAFCDRMNAAAEKLKEYDLTLAYHNHFFEFSAAPNGQKALDYLAEQCPSLEFILDTYWVRFAKQSNAEYIKALTGRLRNIHLKDYRKKWGFIPLMCECGRGSLDFRELLSLFEEAGTQYALIEQDISSDPKRSVEQSLRYLRSL